MTTTAKGRAGEDLAVLHLERAGYVIVGRNVRAGRDELDVVARDGDVLCFIEVRRRAKAEDAMLSIDAKKQARIVRAAMAYVAREGAPLAPPPPCRFDVVIVAGTDVTVIRGAFEATARDLDGRREGGLVSVTKLAVVCTPIGNLGDLSPRASAVLKEASLVLCEDTRHSRPLLERVGSTAKLVSCHAHNERDRKELVVTALKNGEKVALISDAGAPGVSDPGGRIVEEVIAAGCEIEVVPGPTALTGALMGAGIDVNRFAFFGFLPKSGGGRTELLEGAARAGLGVVIYEAPQRTEETLADMFAVLGARRVVVARELTKMHETFHRGVLAPMPSAAALTPPFVEKGEVVIVVEAGAPRVDALAGEDVEAIARDESLPPKERARRIAKVLGVPVREAYQRVQKAGDDVDTRLARVRDHLASAAKALLEADDLARAERGLPRVKDEQAPVDSDIPGADVLMALLARPPSFRAPVEGVDAAKSLLAALAALDLLMDALEFERDP